MHGKVKKVLLTNKDIPKFRLNPPGGIIFRSHAAAYFPWRFCSGSDTYKRLLKFFNTTPRRSSVFQKIRRGGRNISGTSRDHYHDLGIETSGKHHECSICSWQLEELGSRLVPLKFSDVNVICVSRPLNSDLSWLSRLFFSVATLCSLRRNPLLPSSE